MAVKVVPPEFNLRDRFFDAAEFARTALRNSQALASVIDLSLLKPETTRDQVAELCEQAAEFRFASAMVAPAWVSLAHSVVAGSGVSVGTVVGFPLGASLATTKREEAREIVKLGARDLEMVLNIGNLKSGMHALVEREIRIVAEVAHQAGAILKVILETCLLTVQEKLRAAELAISAGADFLKTTTGFSRAGSTVNDVALLRGIAGNRCGVKAGDVNTLASARVMLEAGASRLGTSGDAEILHTWERRFGRAG